MSRTIFDKIWDSHRIASNAGGGDLILIDRILLHERTGGVALKSLAERGRTVLAPDQAFAVMDHIVDTRPGRTDRTLMPTGTDFIRATREGARAAGLRLFDLDDPAQGIVHVMSPELGLVLPGATLVCPDSHTCSQGALGALAWGIGSTEAEHALATSTLRQVIAAVRGAAKSGPVARELDDDEILAVLTAEVKKRRESAEIYTGAGAADRAANETAEADFVETYLPAALSDADLDALVSEAIASTGASSMKDMGAVMKAAQAAAAGRGRVDGKVLSGKVRAALS